MIAAILPPDVVACSRSDDAPISMLFAEEEEAVARAVSSRRREFATGRACARGALGRLGEQPVALPVGSHGEPRWPAGVIGSITHCAGFCAAAVAASDKVVALGIDATPHAALPRNLVDSILLPSEQESIRSPGSWGPGVHVDRVVFSAKEAAYKAWHRFGKRVLDFHDAWVTVDLESRSFCVSFAGAAVVFDGVPVRYVAGRWVVRHGVVLTAVAMTRRELVGVQMQPSIPGPSLG